jgi:hypothetical protein
MRTNSQSDVERLETTDVGVEGPARLRQPAAMLERALIEDFLATQGYTLQSVDRLPPQDREQLLRAAGQAASLRLAEIESRAHLVDEIGGPA